MNDIHPSTNSTKINCKKIVPKIPGVIFLSTAYKPLIRESHSYHLSLIYYADIKDYKFCINRCSHGKKAKN
jgi:hypothetical protein